jgi:23S rRNA-/tRNA-specific pseudouridylate synthase
MSADQTHILSVEPGEGGRPDRFVAGRLADLSRTTVQRLIEDGFITRDGSACEASDKVRPGDVFVVRIPPPAPSELSAEDIPLVIVYEDDDVVVIDKRQGWWCIRRRDMTAARWSMRCWATFRIWEALAAASAAKCAPASCIAWTKIPRG